MKLWLWTVAAAILIASLASLPGQAAETDLRVLVDTSGSMKQSDPQNLRAPALRLLAGLLPKGNRAGVWAFDQQVVVLTPPGEVTDAWQAAARRSADRINSRGLFTDIGGALERALVGWEKPAENQRRGILLLTDGKVDISKDPFVNEQARARVLKDTLERLQRSGAVIYTIALSDDADYELLEKLARTTNGWFERAEDATTLQRLFLRMFEKAVQRDTVPLKQNRFTVDGSIREMTLVVFRRPGAAPTQVMAPDGSRFSQEALGPRMRWATEQEYDMVTVEQPTPGKWQVLADIDPDNRVMVVTDLRVELSPLPAQAMVGESLALGAQLLERGKPMTDPDFLKVLGATLTRRSEGGESQLRAMFDNGQPPDAVAGDGVLSADLDGLLRPGGQELIVRIEGATFQRERRHSIYLYPPPVDISLEARPDGGKRLLVRPIPGLLDPGTVEVKGLVVDPGERSMTLSLPREGEMGWSALLPRDGPPGHYTVSVQIQAKTTQNRAVNLTLPPLGYEMSPPPTAAAPTPVPPPLVSPPPPEESPWSWGAVLGLIIFNGLLAAGAWFGIGLWKERREALVIALTGQFEL